MGETTKVMKRVSVPVQCGWCEQIKVGMSWMQDRRTLYGGRYSPGVCPECRKDFFLDSLTQVDSKSGRR